MAIIFAGDDAGYMAWIAACRGGYVLNVRRVDDRNYAVLHRSSCGTVARPRDDGAYTCRGYRKVCDENISGLATWVARHGRPDGSFSKRCGLCHPPISD